MPAKGDDTWRALGGSVRVCVCGRKLRVTEVVEARTRYPGGRREIRGACCSFEHRDTGDETDAA